MINLRVASSGRVPVEQEPFEVVERKGLGHPDTLCDTIAERASREYARYGLQQFGRVPHHWFDKVMLLGAEADVSCGRGVLLKPYKVIVAGKAALSVGDHPIPVHEILRGAAVGVLGEVLRGFDPVRHLDLAVEVIDHQGAGRGHSRYRPHSRDDLLDLDDPNRVSNDSNIVSGFFPLTTLERMVLDTELRLNGSEFRAQNPDTGCDIKVFGRRIGREFFLLVNVPFLASLIPSPDTYFRRKAELADDLRAWLGATFGFAPNLMLNATDRNGCPYLTALGSVADTGDVGAVGRGNRINGLITPMRPMGIEAPAGKNPLDHTGKLYSLLAHRLARRLYEEVGRSIEVHIFTSKEAPLTAPDDVFVYVQGEGDVAHLTDRIRPVVRHALETVGALGRECIVDGVVLW